MDFHGSGKSTWIKNKYDYSRIFFHNTIILSSDQVREELYGDINDQTHNTEVFQYIKDRAVEELENDNRVIIDATNITRKSRKSIVDYIDLKTKGFYDYGCIKYVVIATPYYKCLENNMKRDRVVPEEVIERMYKQFEFPTYRELVHKIEIVYPFEVNNETYREEPAYKKYYSLSHQNKYHKLSIGEHMEEAHRIMKVLSNNKIMLAAAELHDIGKPFCKKIDDETGNAHYLSHENVGSYEAMFYAKKRKFTTENTIELCNLIQFHMRLYNCESEKSFTKLKDITGNNLYYKLKQLNIADKEAH